MGFFRINGQKPIEIQVGNSRVAQIMLNGSVIYPEVEIDWSKAAVITVKRGGYRNDSTNVIYLNAPDQYGDGGSTDVVVDWGDGTIEYAGSGMFALRHTYNLYADENVIYTVKIFATTFAGFDYGWWMGSGIGDMISQNVQVRVQSLVTMGKMSGLTKDAMWDAFGGCMDLSEISAGALDNCANCDNFDYVFRNTNLKTVPAGLFSKCKAATSFMGAFLSTQLTSIPTGLFANLPKVTTFLRAFAHTKLTSTGSGTFSNCPSAYVFTDVYRNCYEMTAISADIFSGCPKAEYFISAFEGNKKLTSIPASLFNACPDISNLEYAFRDCEKVTSSVPTLWTRTNVNSHSRCYYGCLNAANYAQIPSNWK